MALNEFMAWFQQAPQTGFTKATVSAWRVSLEERRLGSLSIIIRMSAIRKLAAEAADNGSLAPELALGISRVESVNLDLDRHPPGELAVAAARAGSTSPFLPQKRRYRRGGRVLPALLPSKRRRQFAERMLKKLPTVTAITMPFGKLFLVRNSIYDEPAVK
jgi:hypothetical protein